MIIDRLAEQLSAVTDRLRNVAALGSEIPLEQALAEVCSDLRALEARLKAEEAAGQRTEAELAARLQQQAAVATLGLRVLAGGDVQALMDDAARIVAETLQVELCKILEILPGRDALLLRAGVG